MTREAKDNMRNFFLLLVLCTVAAVAAWPQEEEDVEPMPAWVIQLIEIVEAVDNE